MQQQLPFDYRNRRRDWLRVSGYSERQRLVRRKRTDLVHYQVPVAPESGVIGRKFIFFSDLHWNEPSEFFLESLQEISEYITEYQPDTLIFGGDLTVSLGHLNTALEALRKLPEVPLKLAMPGNWERRRGWISVDSWRQFFARANFQLLVQEWQCAQGFAFFGADDIKKGILQPPENYPSGYPILLAHNPDTVTMIGDDDLLAKFRLILCGHTHGGQIRLPLIGVLKTSSCFDRRLDYGEFRHRKTDTRLRITSGIGFTLLPWRWRCRPEAVLVEFQSDRPSEPIQAE